MANYKWQQYDLKELGDRFPEGTDRINAWRKGASLLTEGALTPQSPWLNMISARRPPLQRPCPKVFISHRQSDFTVANRLAYLAHEEAFDYWLDVVDLPAEKTKQVLRIEANLGRALTPFEANVLQAAIIEMALINCTHVVALMTKQTAGSQRVPYEYGRVDRRGTAKDAATAYCVTASIKKVDLPEYLHLAPIHEFEKEIRHWFKAEMALFTHCTEQEQRKRSPWTDEIPAPLSEEISG